MLRKIAINAILVAASTAIALCVAEGALRLGGLATTASYYLLPPHAKLHDAQTEWDLVYETDGRGFRDEEIAPRAASGTFRIAVVGDSFVFGQGCRRGEIFPDRLESSLRSAGARIEVINASNVGLGPEAYRAIVREAVLPLHPDLVIVNVYGNDASESRERPAWRALVVRSAEHSRLVTVVRKFVRALMLRSDPIARGESLGDGPFPSDTDGTRAEALQSFRRKHGFASNNLITLLVMNPAECGRCLTTDESGTGWKDFTRYMGELADDCRRADVPLVLGYVPDAAQVDPGHAALLRSFTVPVPADVLTAPSRFESLVTAFAQARGLPLFDPTAAFRAASTPTYYEADLHWNPAGHALYAFELEKFLRARVLLPPPGARP